MSEELIIIIKLSIFLFVAGVLMALGEKFVHWLLPAKPRENQRPGSE